MIIRFITFKMDPLYSLWSRTLKIYFILGLLRLPGTSLGLKISTVGGKNNIFSSPEIIVHLFSPPRFQIYDAGKWPDYCFPLTRKKNETAATTIDHCFPQVLPQLLVSKHSSVVAHFVSFSLFCLKQFKWASILQGKWLLSYLTEWPVVGNTTERK